MGQILISNAIYFSWSVMVYGTIFLVGSIWDKYLIFLVGSMWDKYLKLLLYHTNNSLVFSVCTFKLFNVINVARHMMGPHTMMFEVHHGGTFDRQHRVHYIGGLVSNYPDTYNAYKLKFSNIEDICKTYVL